MNNEIKSIFANTIGTISYLIVIFFFVTLIMFIHNEVHDALKEAWVASIYFLSVLATLGAAFIASKLFNDWRDIEKFKRTLELYEYGIYSLQETINKLNKLQLYFNAIEIGIRFSSNNKTFSQRFFENKESQKRNKDYEKFLTERESLLEECFLHCFELNNKYYIDYLKCLENDEKLKKILSVNTDVMNLLKIVMLDSDNCAYMLNFMQMKERVLDEFKIITS
ncbi:hypothetical protein ASC84_19080 [Acinetobacter sp. Root1280]|uniref:hypothetical protein n=1 Tax=Acinetobacter sp. Root1280 TaxID=1736444 RepID=UPI0007015A87|nr:hypothetical protein [Acinetobacter sp. Root1280]KQX00134.1 hypothetical protein ASC84_19080 [Acinetobacter sp. Root1280]